MTLTELDIESATPEPQDDRSDHRPHPTQRPRRPSLERLLVVTLGVVGIVAAALEITRLVTYARHYESTDDAFIEARIVPISTKLAGYVQTVAVEDNQHVQKDDLLVQLDDRDQQSKFQQAKAALVAAQSRLSESRTQLQVLEARVVQSRAEQAAAQANADYANTESRRYESMAAGASSPQERSNARSAADAANANVAAAQSRVTAAEAGVANGASHVATSQAEVSVAQAQVAQAELDLSYTTIRSPETGHVTRKNVENGAYLQQGQALLALVPDDIWVIANFKETQLGDMRPGQPVRIKVDAYPAHQLTGHVDSIQAGTGSRFSLLPPENATGNYVKVVQRVPVKIVFDQRPPEGVVFAPGMSVVPEVRVKE